MLSVAFSYYYPYCQYAECHISYYYAECQYAECLNAVCHYAEFSYGKCHNIECRGAFSLTKTF